MSDYKIYYGEYTLQYWINMILRGEIILPDYQRDFVWSENKVIKFIQSLQEGQFVPPVTIGTYIKNDKNYHYVLDGQQRLSSLLLMWLGIYPTGGEFSSGNESDLADNDDNDDPEDNDTQNVKKWSFKYVQGKLTNESDLQKDKVLRCVKSESLYSDIQMTEQIPDEFWKEKSLGFAYIKPLQKDVTKQAKYYSSLFRNINISSVQLTPLESRSSLYWLKEELKDFFQPQFFNNVKVNNSYKVDFVKYLAILFQYEKSDRNINLVAKGYSHRGKKIESYFENYIYSIIGERPDNAFSTFSSLSMESDWQARIRKLTDTYDALELDKNFTSIKNADSFIFGLTYWILLKNKSIDTTKKEDLKIKINNYITTMDNDPKHRAHPDQLQHLRGRLQKSVSIYEEYLQP